MRAFRSGGIGGLGAFDQNMSRERTTGRGARAAGLAIVLALHGAALWGLWAQGLIPTPRQVMTVFVDFIALPVPPRVEPLPKLKPPTRIRREEKPLPRQSVAEAAEAPHGEVAAPAPAPAPVSAAAPEAKPSAGPLVLGGELAASCLERPAPDYPLASRRLGEAGTAVVRVELDEHGHVDAARVANGSGFARLDAAALDAVKTWRCTPAQRDGRPVRAVALQTFKFVLQGS